MCRTFAFWDRNIWALLEPLIHRDSLAVLLPAFWGLLRVVVLLSSMWGCSPASRDTPAHRRSPRCGFGARLLRQRPGQRCVEGVSTAFEVVSSVGSVGLGCSGCLVGCCVLACAWQWPMGYIMALCCCVRSERATALPARIPLSHAQLASSPSLPPSSMCPPPTCLDQPPGAYALVLSLFCRFSLLRADLRCQLCSHSWLKHHHHSHSCSSQPIPAAIINLLPPPPPAAAAAAPRCSADSCTHAPLTAAHTACCTVCPSQSMHWLLVSAVALEATELWCIHVCMYMSSLTATATTPKLPHCIAPLRADADRHQQQHKLLHVPCCCCCCWWLHHHQNSNSAHTPTTQGVAQLPRRGDGAARKLQWEPALLRCTHPSPSQLPDLSQPPPPCPSPVGMQQPPPNTLQHPPGERGAHTGSRAGQRPGGAAAQRRRRARNGPPHLPAAAARVTCPGSHVWMTQNPFRKPLEARARQLATSLSNAADSLLGVQGVPAAPGAREPRPACTQAS